MISSIKSGLCALLMATTSISFSSGLYHGCESLSVALSASACPPQEWLAVATSITPALSPLSDSPPSEWSPIMSSPAMMPMSGLLDHISVSPMLSSEEWMLYLTPSASSALLDSSPSVSFPSKENLLTCTCVILSVCWVSVYAAHFGWLTAILPTMLTVLIASLDCLVLSRLGMLIKVAAIHELLRWIACFIWVNLLDYYKSHNRGDPEPFILLLQSYFIVVEMNLLCPDQIHPPEELAIQTQDAILVYLMSLFTVLLVSFVLNPFHSGLRRRTAFLRDKIVYLHKTKSEAFMYAFMIVGGLLWLIAAWCLGKCTDSEKKKGPKRRQRRQRRSKTEMKRSRSGPTQRERRRRPSLRRRTYRARRRARDRRKRDAEHELFLIRGVVRVEENLRKVEMAISMIARLVGTCLAFAVAGNVSPPMAKFILLLFWGPVIFDAATPFMVAISKAALSLFAAIVCRLHRVCYSSSSSEKERNERPEAGPGDGSSSGPGETPSSKTHESLSQKPWEWPPFHPESSPRNTEHQHQSHRPRERPPAEPGKRQTKTPASGHDDEDDDDEEKEDDDDDDDEHGVVRTLPLRSDREFCNTILHPKNNQVPGPDEYWMEPVENDEEASDPCSPAQYIVVEPPCGKPILVEFHPLKRISDIKDEVSDFLGVPQCSYDLRIVGGWARLHKTHLTVRDCRIDESTTLAIEPNNILLLGGNDNNEQRNNLPRSFLGLDKAPEDNELLLSEDDRGQVLSSLVASQVNDTRREMNGKDRKIEDTFERNCAIFGIQYSSPGLGETEEEKKSRRVEMNRMIGSARKKKQRDNQTPEKKRSRKESNKISMQISRAKQTAEKKKSRQESNKISMQISRANQTAEQKVSRQESDKIRKQIERENETPDVRRQRQASNANSTRIGRENASPSQKRRRLDEQKERSKNNRANTSAWVSSSETAQQDLIHEDSLPTVPEPVKNIETENRVDDFCELQRQQTQVPNEPDMHQARVCCICDCHILGTDTVHMAKRERILLNKERLSVKGYEVAQGKLNPVLVKQYEIPGFEGMLLSPRARVINGSFETCSSCFRATAPKEARTNPNPPKFAIANGFAVGEIPYIIASKDAPEGIRKLSEDALSDILCAAVSPQRPFAYVFTYTGGAQQSVVGHYSFFETDQNLVGGVINNFIETGANENIVCAFVGRMTPRQRDLAQQRATLDAGAYKDLMRWFIEVAEHPAYKGVRTPENCPRPVMLPFESTENNTDKPVNPEVEEVFEGGTYTFTSGLDPSAETSLYADSTQFALAMLNRTSPLLLVYGGNYINAGHELKLEHVMPIQFPFGQGGPVQARKRRVAVSKVECLKYYLRHSLPQFKRGNFILVVNHLYNRIMSYESGVITCRSATFNGESFAESVSTLTEAQIKEAARKMDKNEVDNSIAGEFLRRVNTSCKAIGYTKAAADAALRQMYALCDYLGYPDIFFTLTPDDECSFRVRVRAKPGIKFKMPSLDCTDEDCYEDYIIRRDVRLRYPGACSLEYQSAVQIALEGLFGWDPKKQMGTNGIFGKLKAYAAGHEEQGRKTLHGHWNLWVEDLQSVRDTLFHPDKKRREEARENYLAYVNQVMSAKYGDEIKVEHLCQPRADQQKAAADKTDIASEKVRASSPAEASKVYTQQSISERTEISHGAPTKAPRCGPTGGPTYDSVAIGTNAGDSDGGNELEPPADHESALVWDTTSVRVLGQPTALGSDNSEVPADSPVQHNSGVASNADESRPASAPAKLDERVDSIFFDYKEDHPDRDKQLQRLRDARSKNTAPDVNGKILTCIDCGELFTTTEVVDMALDRHKQLATEPKNLSLPMSQYRLDLAAYRYTYDYPDMTAGSTNFWMNKEVRYILLTRKFNEHDSNHRMSCFKKGCECRFMFPFRSCDFTNIEEDPGEEDEHRMDWYNDFVNRPTPLPPYMIELERPQGCQYVNTHSVPASAVFSCNTNVQIGSPTHVHYITNYSFKDTQPEDRARHLRIGTQVIRRLLRMKTNAANQDGEDQDNDSDQANFTEGLSRILSGMSANLSKAVCSSTLAHFIICNDGSRFNFSHGFSQLLASQAMDVLNGKPGNFRIRRNFSKETEKAVMWPDSQLDDFRYRPDDLDDLCYYEQMMLFEKIPKTFNEMNKAAPKKKAAASMIDDEAMDMDANDDDCNEEAEGAATEQKRYRFRADHPGFHFSYLQRQKFKVVPIVSVEANTFCRLEELELHSDNPSSDALTKRETYAKMALLLFLKNFRDIKQLKEEDYASSWDKFMAVHKNKELFWEQGERILLNIEHRLTAQKMKRARDPIVKDTQDPEGDSSDSGLAEKSERKADLGDTLTLAHFDEDVERDEDDDYRVMEGYNQKTLRTNNHLVSLADLGVGSSIPARVESISSLLRNDNNGEASSKSLPSQSDSNNANTPQQRQGQSDRSYPTLLTFIHGSLVGNIYDYKNRDGDEMEEDDEMDWEDDSMFADASSTTNDVAGRRKRKIPSLVRVARKVARKEGIDLDDKQYIAYEIIACSFLLRLINEGADSHSGLGMYLSASRGEFDPAEKRRLIQQLKARGGQDQLIMFLTGFAGAGKSTCIKVAQRFCFEFCRAVSIEWSDKTFYFTATTGSAASLFDGLTIHTAAGLCKKSVTAPLRREWDGVKMLVLDEVSFFSLPSLQKLDRNLRKITGQSNKVYGGMNIIFSGDFHQLPPVKVPENQLLYNGLMNGLWEGNINTVIVLENSHRFDGDPEYGEIMYRMWRGETTVEDIRKINERYIGRENVKLPNIDKDDDISFACPKNVQRNSISAKIFKQHILDGSFPPVDSDDLPPEHTIIIEADIQSGSSTTNGKTRVNREIRDRIIATCGDSTVTTNSSRLVDPCLRIYNGAHKMCSIDNSMLDKGVGNGTCCRAVGVKLKDGAPPLRWKNWDGVKVYCVSVRHVEWVEFEHYPDTPKIASTKAAIDELEARISDNSAGRHNEEQVQLSVLRAELSQLRSSRRFKLKPKTNTATVKVAIDDNVTQTMEITGVSITQIPVVDNDGTTGHKLQGMSKDKLIVVDWAFNTNNWVYVVLSRVRTLEGLFLLKELPESAIPKLAAPPELIQHEDRLRAIERLVLDRREQMMRELDDTDEI